VDALVVAVSHKLYRDMGLARLAGLCGGSRAVVVDVKSAFDPGEAEKKASTTGVCDNSAFKILIPA
jgi:UDP-N-acetyl-D-galactosamine dehydrogenase